MPDRANKLGVSGTVSHDAGALPGFPTFAQTSKNGETGRINGPSRSTSSLGINGSTLPSGCTVRDQVGAIVVLALDRGTGANTHRYASCGTELPPRRAIAFGGSTKIAWIVAAIGLPPEIAVK